MLKICINIYIYVYKKEEDRIKEGKSSEQSETKYMSFILTILLSTNLLTFSVSPAPAVSVP